MSRKQDNSSKPIFHSPMLIDWTEERLRPLSQEQLLNLLGNLDHQKRIGRLPEFVATEIEQRISTLLTTASSTKRRKQRNALAVATGAAEA